MWMGIDVGTGGTRALLVDQQGRVKASQTAAHDDMTMLQPLWAEQRPENWWSAARTAIRGALEHAGIRGREVRGIGLSGQMHGLVLLDQSNQVIRPSLIWCDQRSQAQVDFVNRKVGAERVLAYTANPVLTGFTLPKLLWVRDHEPQNFERARKMLLPKDYLRFQLTGEYASEVSDASGNGAVRRGPSPLVVRTGRRAGPRSGSAARSVRIERSVGHDIAAGRRSDRLRGGNTRGRQGGGDQASSAVGNGIVEPGLVSCTLGTSGVVFAHMETVQYRDPLGRVHTFCHARFPRKWHVMGVTQGAGSQPAVVSQQSCSRHRIRRPHEGGSHCARRLGRIVLAASYLMGERTPHLDALARGGWVGLTAKHRRAELIRSIVEGVSYSQKDCLVIVEELGAEARSVRASGGGAQSPFWRQTLADDFGEDRRDAGISRGIGVWRRTAGNGRHRRLFVGAGSLRRRDSRGGEGGTPRIRLRCPLSDLPGAISRAAASVSEDVA